MDEFQQIKMSVFLILLLQFTGAEIERRVLFARVGDEATLPCNYVIQDQDECDGTNWIFRDSVRAVMLVKGGQIGNHAKSDRLRVTEKCSLVIKKVTEEDAGYYTCRHFRLREGGPETQVDLSVVTMTEHQVNNEVTLRCSVTRSGRCEHSVKWLLQGQDVDKDNRDIRTSESRCSASVTFLTSHYFNTPRSELFTCAVDYGDNMQTFSLQFSGEDTAAATESDTRSGFTTTASVITEDATGEDTTATESDTRSGFTTTASVITEDATGWWWWIIVVIVGVAALTIITVAVIRRKRTQGQRPQTDENIVRYDVDDGTVNYDNIRPPDGV